MYKYIYIYLNKKIKENKLNEKVITIILLLWMLLLIKEINKMEKY